MALNTGEINLKVKLALISLNTDVSKKVSTYRAYRVLQKSGKSVLIFVITSVNIH